ncbi:hypothetical protein B0H63DRAFT_299273 [Podospora didyma]|uniref:HMG box domain-containing protein n=1 Tax=Podospora didyma TaxID=330526 RepID=A0AAE0N6H4_9PEZI|nr:hypothetical protein B0H63DRAFT_299273 [Podospora didyma]
MLTAIGLAGARHRLRVANAVSFRASSLVASRVVVVAAASRFITSSHTLSNPSSAAAAESTTAEASPGKLRSKPKQANDLNKLEDKLKQLKEQQKEQQNALKALTQKQKEKEKEKALKQKKSEKQKALKQKKSESEKALRQKKRERALKQKEREKALKQEATQKAKALEEIALVGREPAQLQVNPYFLFLQENYKSAEGVGTDRTSKLAKSYKALSAEELKRLQDQAEQNRAANQVAYKAWVASFTPSQVQAANIIRKHIKRETRKRRSALGKKLKKYPEYLPIVDDRLPMKPAGTGYQLFQKESLHSGPLASAADSRVRVTEASKLWNAMNEEERKPYQDAAAADRERWTKEAELVFGKDSPLASGLSIANALAVVGAQ